MENIAKIWGPIRSIIRERFTSYRISQILGLAGFDMDTLAGLPLTTSTEDKNQLINVVDNEYSKMDNKNRNTFLIAIIEEMLSEKPDLLPEIEKRTIRLGWKFYDNSPIPIELFDVSELIELPLTAHPDLVKAAKKMRDGDYSGAISSACGAIDTVTADIYMKKGLGEPGDASFQEKIGTCLKKLDVYTKLERELTALNWEPSNIKLLKDNYSKSINQAAYVMGSLRRNMGDVHGTKPVLQALVFDSIKWSSLILRLLHSK